MNTLNIFHFFIICFLAQQCASQPVEKQVIKTSTPVPAAWNTKAFVPQLQGKKTGCVVNHSSLIGRTHLVDSLVASGIPVAAIFAPEHGFRGGADAGEHVTDGKDTKTGVPIISLYGKHRKPTTDDLQTIDVMLFDIQDVGVRFYTYISTLHLVMEACAENDVSLIILDRPNPNGYYVDGPILDTAFTSFIGMHEIPVVYGLTIGELAKMINGEYWLKDSLQCDLTVFPCASYDHSMTYDLPVAPSPNLPNHRSVLLYPSICFFEGTHVSVGRGTDKQFQVIGHPDYPDHTFSFTPVSKPGASNPPKKDTLCYGEDLTLLRTTEILQWKRLNLSWLLKYHEVLKPPAKFFLTTNHFALLAGSEELRQQIEQGMGEEEIRASWQPDLRVFMEKRKKYLLYPDFGDD